MSVKDFVRKWSARGYEKGELLLKSNQTAVALQRYDDF